MLNLFLDAIENIHLQEHVPIEDQMNNALHLAEVVCQKLRHLAARIESFAKPVPCLLHDKRQTNAVDMLESGGSSCSHSTEKSVYSQPSIVFQSNSSPLERPHLRRKAVSDVEQMKLMSALSSSKRDAWFLPVGSSDYNNRPSTSSDIIPRPSHPAPQIVLKGLPHSPRNPQQPGAPVSKNVYRNTPSAYYLHLSRISRRGC